MERKKLQSGPTDVRQLAKLTSATYMLLTVSFMFIALTLPACVYYLIARLYGPTLGDDVYTQARLKLFYTSTGLLGYSSNTINFLLYCMSGSAFRREFLALFRSSKK
jgi:hypothetical protein